MRFIYLLFVLSGLFTACDLLTESGNTDNPITPPAPNPNPNNNWNPDNPVNPNTSDKLTDYLPTQYKGDQLVKHKYYSASYCSKYKNSEWVAYELTDKRVKAPDVDRRSHSFHADPAFSNTAANSDYTNSGYDRGHLAPANDMSFNEDAMDESFLMTNVSPQDPAFNRGIWKSLEDKVRDWAVADKRIYVVTGPILPGKLSSSVERIGANEDVVVPKYFYKIVLDYEGKDKKAIAFIFKNEESTRPIADFATTIDLVEQKTGIDFFPNLSAAEQTALEATSDPSLWKGLTE